MQQKGRSQSQPPSVRSTASEYVGIELACPCLAMEALIPSLSIFFGEVGALTTTLEKSVTISKYHEKVYCSPNPCLAKSRRGPQGQFTLIVDVKHGITQRNMCLSYEVMPAFPMDACLKFHPYCPQTALALRRSYLVCIEFARKSRIARRWPGYLRPRTLAPVPR